ncbi:MAG TPA: hypothetical protein VHO48_06490, partial [Anaerolineaceae bacterium]|nr:hypothetical protein [Anaerolineaceae bacterium]
EEIRKTMSPARGWNGRWPSTVTQFVVGGVGENDLELLTTTEYLYRRLNLKRAYFSGFEPISDTPLEGHPPTNPWREHRLYQASFLLRDYGFDLEDMPFEQTGYLPLGVDPKKAWAEVNLSQAPVEINRADRHELLRVPGIGIKGVEAILAARQRQRVHSLGELRALGIQVNRVAGYILIDGKRPPIQASLF